MTITTRLRLRPERLLDNWPSAKPTSAIGMISH